MKWLRINSPEHEIRLPELRDRLGIDEPVMSLSQRTTGRDGSYS